jgi:hypothetical protein
LQRGDDQALRCEAALTGAGNGNLSCAFSRIDLSRLREARACEPAG